MLERDPRAAGDLARYHTWRTVQQQTVAAHTWQFLRILLAIWPECPRALLVDALFHDVGEVAVGDMPYPSKATNPALKAEVDRLERNAHLAMCLPWGVPAPIVLEPPIYSMVKLAHMLEMWEFGLVEFELGNRHGLTIASRCMGAVEPLLETLDGLPIATAARRYIEKRQTEHRGVIHAN